MNQQKIESIRPESNTLDVHSIFYTIQGEAIHAGRPAVFLRLAGCNLQCANCDTDYTTDRKEMTMAEIAAEINQYPTKLVIITGGEPFRQHFARLFDHLLGYEFQIETNGILCPDWIIPYVEDKPSQVKVVICPKTPFINQDWRLSSCSRVMYKYVMHYKSISKEDGLPISVLGKTSIVPARPHSNKCRIYLQPEDMGKTYANRRNVEACIESCMKHGHTLCLQIHKLVGLP